MDLSKIISITGKSGLYRVIAPGRQAIIAESLEDGKRLAVPSSVRVSSLDEISMFTTGDDEPLKNILEKLYKNAQGGASADPKSDEASLWKTLTEALPNADKERIYPSDVRKLFLWYTQLLKAGVFAEKDEKTEDDGEEKPKEGSKSKKSAGKATSASTGTGTKKASTKPSGASKATAVRRGGQRGA
ncbi:MAG: DUF5606 domain-containing protein [Bacteroidetes bacterium]|nr:DUF5606 domain-containing protein [Bacteroidota bacterium]MBX7130387.1 DUF5606 domain-containing protein [Flavobacteriales bacterium]MCC6655798.1 DUF5606 domain-containing protein [Flavobacteriales bacterium]HMU14037.1 DUF5606 domain-containing protein [Flavobacteriales bacterium]HMW95797.1 DUF5606 domain-containing protein [Flavobacteriales bacterium]